VCEISILHPIDSLKCIGERILDGVGHVVGSAFDSIFGSIVDWLTRLVTEAVASVVSTLGTFWVNIHAPAVGDASNTPVSSVGWLISHLGWYTAALAVVSILVGAGRMALARKAQPGVDTARSVLTFTVVCGAGVAVTGLLTEAADQFSVWIISESTGGSFGENLTVMLGFAAASGIGLILVLILGFIAILASLIQVVLMVMRIAMLYLLVAMLPTAAAATNTEMGKQWFKKLLAWLVAWILYKPVASIIYALAFKLVGDQSIFASGGLLSVLIGVSLMLMALFGLPALLRFLVPAVAAVAGGSGAGAMAAGAMATGAMLLGGAPGGFGRAGLATGGGSPGPAGSATGAGPGPGATGGGGSSGSATAAPSQVTPTATGSTSGPSGHGLHGPSVGSTKGPDPDDDDGGPDGAAS
jgi:type IV secretion system protein TrbL